MVTERRLYQLYEPGAPGAGIDSTAIVGEVPIDQVPDIPHSKLASDVRVYSGLWNGTTQYLTGQSVQHDSLIWRATDDSLNVEPALIAGNSWALVGLPIEPTDAEVDAGTSTDRRSWTPAAIRRAVRNGNLLTTFDGHGAPTFSPTVHGQIEVNSVGNVYVAADELVEVTSAPSFDESMVATIEPNQATWPYWRGLSTLGFDLIRDGDFIYVYRTREFSQRQATPAPAVTISRLWSGVLEYARANAFLRQNAPTNLFPVTGETDSVFLSGDNHEFRSDAEVAAHIAANQLSDTATTPFLWIQRDNNPIIQWQLRLAQPGAYNAGTVSVITRLHWVRQALREEIPPHATDAEIDAGSSEDTRLVSPAQLARAAGQGPNKRVVDEVDRISPTFQGALVYLTHDYTEGGKLDLTVTAGFNVLDIGGGFVENEAGYDSGRFDGTPYGSADRNIAPIEQIEGTGTTAGYVISGIVSYNAPFMAAVSMVEINGTQYAVGSEIVSGGIITRRFVSSTPVITDATFTFNVMRADNSWVYTNGDTRIDRAGLYQWDPDTNPQRYTEGLFGPFQQVALELAVYAGSIYRVGTRLYAPTSDFVIDADRLPPDGTDVDANWVEVTNTSATPGGQTIVTPGEVELPVDWSLNETRSSWIIIEEGRIWVTFVGARSAPFKINAVEGWFVPPDAGERYRLVVAICPEGSDGNREVSQILYTSPYRTVPQVVFANAETHPDSEIFTIPDDDKPEVPSDTVVGIGFERESATRTVVDVHVGEDRTFTNNQLETVEAIGGGGYDNFAVGTTGLVVNTARTARIIIDADILLEAGIETGDPLGLPTQEQARASTSETPYIWTPQRVHQASRVPVPVMSDRGRLLVINENDEYELMREVIRGPHWATSVELASEDSGGDDTHHQTERILTSPGWTVTDAGTAAGVVLNDPRIEMPLELADDTFGIMVECFLNGTYVTGSRAEMIGGNAYASNSGNIMAWVRISSTEWIQMRWRVNQAMPDLAVYGARTIIPTGVTLRVYAMGRFFDAN